MSEKPSRQVRRLRNRQTAKRQAALSDFREREERQAVRAKRRKPAKAGQ
jgi:hypothetical protein